MRFVARGVKPEDLDGLYNLANQFTLLNLSPDKKALAEIIEMSQASFRGEVDGPQSKYIFVVVDTQSQLAVGCSQIIGKHGTEKNPAYSFKVHTKKRFSKRLNVGFVHQLLRMKVITDGPTEVGGLILSLDYRGHPEKVGRLLSLIRFVYIGMFKERFEKELYAQMVPPLTDDGRSDFWESLGKRFTGLSYQEADRLSRRDKEFISSLFPEDDIYLCLLDSRARLVMGQVGFETQRACRLLQKLGFTYKNEVDPFDGGPHIGVLRDEMPMIKKGFTYDVKINGSGSFPDEGYFGFMRSGDFYGGCSPYRVEGEDIYLPESVCRVYGLSDSNSIYVTKV